MSLIMDMLENSPDIKPRDMLMITMTPDKIQIESPHAWLIRMEM